MEDREQAPTSCVRARQSRPEVAVATSIGRRRTNADAYVSDDAAGFFAVADGMGDTPRSGIVARMALDAVREMFLPPWALLAPAERSPDEAATRMRLGVAQAHGRLYAPGRPREQRIGTTFAGVVVCCGGLLCVGHVGDSRVYLVERRSRTLAQLTDDHTVVGDAACRRRRYEATRRPDAHALTRMIGATYGADEECIVRYWRSGDVVLICTDGVSDAVDLHAQVDTLLDAGDLREAAGRVVDSASGAGAGDNATVMLVRRAT